MSMPVPCDAKENFTAEQSFRGEMAAPKGGYVSAWLLVDLRLCISMLCCFDERACVRVGGEP